MAISTGRRAATAISLVVIFAALLGAANIRRHRDSPAKTAEVGNAHRWHTVNPHQLWPLLRRATGNGAFLHAIEAIHDSEWDSPDYGWPFWAESLNLGAKLALVGGSDDDAAGASSNSGSPTTVVFAEALSERAVIGGLKAGRTYVRVRGPHGPAIEFTAISGGRTYGIGDTIECRPETTISLQATVTGGGNQTLQWIRSGTPFESVELPEHGTVRIDVHPRRGDWYSVVLADDDGPTVFTSAIFTERPR